MRHQTDTSSGRGRDDRPGAPPSQPAPADEADNGLPLPNQEGSVLGEGREEETDAVGKGPRDPVLDGEDDRDPNGRT